MLPMLALAALGAIKAETVDKDKEKRDRALAAATQRYSPWTGLHAGQINEADPVGGAMGGALAGASMEQNQANAASQNALSQAMANYYGRMAPTASTTGLSNTWSGM